MEEDPADRVKSGPTVLVIPSVGDLGHSNGMLLLPLEGELRRIVKHENRLRRGLKAVAGCLEMAREDLPLAHPVIGEKAIGGLRPCPVLTGHRDTLPDPLREPLDQGPEPPSQTDVRELASGELLIDPRCGLLALSGTLFHLPLPNAPTQ